MKKCLFDQAISDTNTLISIDDTNVGAYFIRGNKYTCLNVVLIAFIKKKQGCAYEK